MADARKRTPLPKGEDAEAELRRLRRNQRRAERRARRAALEAGEEGSGGDPITVPQSAMPVDRVPTQEELKRDLMGAFHALGGMAGLVAWGQRYPKEFYALWSKYCLPAQSDDPVDEDGTSLEAMLRKLDEKVHESTQH